ncbi:hypothetical protein [Corynebacterium urinipleomorphum]|nr:hypothetical protein [Corynebacterium urinipleomorphum]
MKPELVRIGDAARFLNFLVGEVSVLPLLLFVSGLPWLSSGFFLKPELLA